MFYQYFSISIKLTLYKCPKNVFLGQEKPVFLSSEVLVVILSSEDPAYRHCVIHIIRR